MGMGETLRERVHEGGVIMNPRAYLRLKGRVFAYVKRRWEEDPFSLPTVRQIGKRFKMRQEEVLTLIEDTEGLGVNIGMQVSGGECWVEEKIGDYTVEAYLEEVEGCGLCGSAG